jgi:hypothetical protein
LFGLKVLPGESLIIQHIILVMDVRVKRKAKMRCHDWDTRIKWWHLKDEKHIVFLQKILTEGCAKLRRSENNMWNKMTYEISKSAKETLGELIDFEPS